MSSSLFVGYRRRETKVGCLLLLLLAIMLLSGCTSAAPIPTPSPTTPSEPSVIRLPDPELKGAVSLEEALLKRRSVRDYATTPLGLEEVSQLLWAAQGVTAGWGGRTAPSAGALYPLEVYLVVGNVENLAAGIYKYSPQRHELDKVKDGDVREQLAQAALGQTCVKEGAIAVVIAAVYERTTAKYGDRGLMYVHMEAGHAAQNVYLQATALDLGMVVVGAFYDDRVKHIIGMPDNEAPLYVIPVGKKKS